MTHDPIPLQERESAVPEFNPALHEADRAALNTLYGDIAEVIESKGMRVEDVSFMAGRAMDVSQEFDAEPTPQRFSDLMLDGINKSLDKDVVWKNNPLNSVINQGRLLQVLNRDGHPVPELNAWIVREPQIVQIDERTLNGFFVTDSHEQIMNGKALGIEPNTGIVKLNILNESGEIVASKYIATDENNFGTSPRNVIELGSTSVDEIESVEATKVGERTFDAEDELRVGNLATMLKHNGDDMLYKLANGQVNIDTYESTVSDSRALTEELKNKGWITENGLVVLIGQSLGAALTEATAYQMIGDTQNPELFSDEDRAAVQNSMTYVTSLLTMSNQIGGVNADLLHRRREARVVLEAEALKLARAGESKAALLLSGVACGMGYSSVQHPNDRLPFEIITEVRDTLEGGQ